MSHVSLPLSTQDAARHLGLSKSTLEKTRLTGTGPRYLKLGRLVRYRIDDLEEWLSERLVTSTSEQRRGADK